MKVLAANIEDVFREAAARWTLIAYFCLSSIFILMFAAAVNLDVVNGALILFTIAALLAFTFLIGVITSSTGVSIMTTYALFLFSMPLMAHAKMEAAVSSEWSAWVIRILYWVLPKSAEIGMAVVAFVSGGTMPEEVAKTLAPAPFVSTALFGLGCFALATLAFKRKEF